MIWLFRRRATTWNCLIGRRVQWGRFFVLTLMVTASNVCYGTRVTARDRVPQTKTAGERANMETVPSGFPMTDSTGLPSHRGRRKTHRIDPPSTFWWVQRDSIFDVQLPMLSSEEEQGAARRVKMKDGVSSHSWWKNKGLMIFLFALFLWILFPYDVDSLFGRKFSHRNLFRFKV